MIATARIPALDDGFGGYLVLAGIALLAHEPWRWLGLVIGRHVDEQSPLFAWIRLVATALVAALVMRLMVFPAGALANTPLGLRAFAFGVGLAAFFAAKRSMPAAVAAATLAFLAGSLAMP